MDQTSQGPEGGPALEITTCDRQGEEIQEDRNNQIKHHLKWNIHSDGGEGEACGPISVKMSWYKAQLKGWRKTLLFLDWIVWECG